MAPRPWREQDVFRRLDASRRARFPDRYDTWIDVVPIEAVEQRALLNRAYRELDRVMAQAFYGGSNTNQLPEPPAEATLTIETMRNAMAELERNFPGTVRMRAENMPSGPFDGPERQCQCEGCRPGGRGFREIYSGPRGDTWSVVGSTVFFGIDTVGGGGGGGVGPGRTGIDYYLPDPEADLRAEALLKEWLSPEQLAQYEQETYFDVVGSDTGKRYRITSLGRNYNVFEIPGKGWRSVPRYCFGPEGTPQGDVMLAQKIAMENFERKAIVISNRTEDPVDLFVALFPESV